MFKRFGVFSLIAPLALASAIALGSTGRARAEHGTVYNHGRYCVAFCNDGTRISFTAPAGQPWTPALCSQQASSGCAYHGGPASSHVTDQR